jgi:hypothetical protein
MLGGVIRDGIEPSAFAVKMAKRGVPPIFPSSGWLCKIRAGSGGGGGVVPTFLLNTMLRPSEDQAGAPFPEKTKCGSS